MNRCQDILKIVRGNGFTLCLQVDARRTDGTAVEDFALQGDEVLKLLHNGTAEAKAYERVDNSIFVTFDGTDALGWYGLEMTGMYANEPWRWCVPKVFQIVETNERAYLPSWTFLADDTYIIGCGITLLTSVCQADWEEASPTAPSYIKNKPDLSEYALVTDLLATNQRVTTLENTAIKTVAQSFSEGQKSTARNNISAASVAQVNAKQDPIADLADIRSGAADGAVARGYLNDFSVATHTSPEQVGEVLAAVATKAIAAQPRLTAGVNITITEDNVISATGGGGSADAVLYTPQTLTAEQQAQARVNIAAAGCQWGVVSQTQKWTKASDGGYDYVMSELQYGWIPKMFVDLVTTAGAIFNATSGYFELNGLTDLSYEEMRVIYNLGPIPYYSSYYMARNKDIRTNLPTQRDLVYNLDWFARDAYVEVLGLNNSQQLQVTATAQPAYICYMAIYLKKIVGVYNVGKYNTFSAQPFTGCYSLEEVSLKELKASISFPSSQRLSVSSILYMITNAANTSVITITLHATAYARAIADSDVQAALEAHPTITLASA